MTANLKYYKEVNGVLSRQTLILRGVDMILIYGCTTTAFILLYYFKKIE